MIIRRHSGNKGATRAKDAKRRSKPFSGPSRPSPKTTERRLRAGTTSAIAGLRGLASTRIRLLGTTVRAHSAARSVCITTLSAHGYVNERSRFHKRPIRCRVGIVRSEMTTRIPRRRVARRTRTFVISPKARTASGRNDRIVRRSARTRLPFARTACIAPVESPVTPSAMRWIDDGSTKKSSLSSESVTNVTLWPTATHAEARLDSVRSAPPAPNPAIQHTMRILSASHNRDDPRRRIAVTLDLDLKNIDRRHRIKLS